jgi:predicted branched-subunit amino acid permease
MSIWIHSLSKRRQIEADACYESEDSSGFGTFLIMLIGSVIIGAANGIYYRAGWYSTVPAVLTPLALFGGILAFSLLPDEATNTEEAAVAPPHPATTR